MKMAHTALVADGQRCFTTSYRLDKTQSRQYRESRESSETLGTTGPNCFAEKMVLIFVKEVA